MLSEEQIKLLAIHDSSNDTEAMVNALRGAGHRVHATRVEDGEDLEAALAKQTFDLAVARPRIEGFTALEGLEVIIRAGRDLPFIVVYPENEREAVPALLRAGARDAIPEDDIERLRHVVTRELADLTERRGHRRYQQMLWQSEQKAKQLIDSSRDAIAYVNEGVHVYANESYLQLLGYEERSDLEGMPLMDLVAPDDQGSFKEFLRGFQKAGQMDAHKITVKVVRADGRPVSVTMEMAACSMDGEPCTRITIRDQSRSKELEQQLDSLARQDLVTGLYNRGFFIEQLEQIAAKAAGGATRGALLYMDIDKFKAIKEAVGIAASDLVLADIAAMLKKGCKPGTVLARFEGHVFTLLLEDADAPRAEQVAERVRKAIEGHISEVANQSLTATCSIGISLINETATGVQDILARAEKACGLARTGGGNRCHLLNPAAQEQANREEAEHWGKLIKSALKSNGFRLVFQPIASLHGEAGEKYQVMLRMRDQQGGDILPSEFLPFAEQLGLMAYIDRWVIAHAIQALAQRREAGRQTAFFVKLSRASLLEPTLLPWISERVNAARLEADNLVFEFSEASALSHLRHARAFIAGAKQLRCRCALSYFGLAENPFGSLKHLEVDILKLDPSLIKGLNQDPEHDEQVKSLIETAHKHGKLTVAEFVEDASALSVLWQTGVDYIQGYFLQEPEAAMNFDFSEIG